jgi:hypothetical protein
MTRPLYEIAAEVYADIRAGNWPAKSNYAALPYLRAMRELSTVNDSYGSDSAESVVLYFLSNAATWRGETARRIKAELKEMVK